MASQLQEEDAGAVREGEPEEDDEVHGDWELFVEDSEESCVMEGDSEPEEEPPRLRALCSSCDPGVELELLCRRYEGYLGDDNGAPEVQEEMATSLEEWELLWPRMSKVEPEFTENIEDLIAGLQEPLRHTHNVNPQEVRAAMERWRDAIVKELGVVEKGFYKTTVDGVRELKKSRKVQELPAKLVYTLKPPSEPGEPGTESAKCKRKARIVCCGNFNSEDPGDVFASGAAAESLRCALALTAMKRWSAGGLDIGGAFMLTPLDDDVNAVLFAVTPPAILVRLKLVEPNERWILTRAMYGLRQSPRLWSVFRDKTVKAMKIELAGDTWYFKQGVAEPNLWYLYKLNDSTSTSPEAVLLIYVDDLLICGPDPLVRAIDSEPKGDEGHLKRAQTMGVALEIRPESGGFEAWSDCSYAPSGCRSHSGMAITWNKAVIGELVAAIETLTLAMSLKAIVDEFGETVPNMYDGELEDAELNALWKLVDLLDPLDIDTPWELYLLVALIAVGVVAGCNTAGDCHAAQCFSPAYYDYGILGNDIKDPQGGDEGKVTYYSGVGHVLYVYGIACSPVTNDFYS
ncbi:RE2, partial [Symbiodinium necroappetens]